MSEVFLRLGDTVLPGGFRALPGPRQRHSYRDCHASALSECQPAVAIEPTASSICMCRSRSPGPKGRFARACSSNSRVTLISIAFPLHTNRNLHHRKQRYESGGPVKAEPRWQRKTRNRCFEPTARRFGSRMCSRLAMHRAGGAPRRAARLPALACLRRLFEQEETEKQRFFMPIRLTDLLRSGIGVGTMFEPRPSLQTGQAHFGHPAFQSVGSLARLDRLRSGYG